ncbi:unnamed protein product, partial [Ectocarpus fasciculatus]
YSLPPTNVRSVPFIAHRSRPTGARRTLYSTSVQAQRRKVSQRSPQESACRWCPAATPREGATITTPATPLEKLTHPSPRADKPLLTNYGAEAGVENYTRVL